MAICGHDFPHQGSKIHQLPHGKIRLKVSFFSGLGKRHTGREEYKKLCDTLDHACEACRSGLLDP